MQSLPPEEVQRLVRTALAEDVGSGDATSLSTVSADTYAKGKIVAREPLVCCGLGLALETFQQVSNESVCKLLVQDGASLKKGETLLEVHGPARALLTAERVALNLLQRLSGISTLTQSFVQAIKGTKARILDTRKTTPGLRLAEKYAVACGGGQNHRFGLFDLILIKDNHLAAISGPKQIIQAVQRARAAYPDLKVEVEADTLEQVKESIEAGADIILLDNMSLDQLRAAVAMVDGKARTEASGGINLSTVRGVAETGVDYISVGAVTHSARAVDIALDFIL
ncbi:MAG: carboxylating nicotinate-nucleotide diphosphorylase [Verrucomicrobiales bacterium]